MDGLTQRRGYDATLFLIALLFGLAIAWMDARPHWDDTGVTVGCLVLSAGLMGLAGPRRPWLWALAIGVWVPLHLVLARVAAHTMTPGTFSYVVILFFPLAGAYAGAGLRRLTARA
ncbi:MAG: hypothetical protein WA414_18160 [Acidobacteriaceae bacterium]